MRALICGSRRWTDDAAIKRRLDLLWNLYDHDVTIVHGAGRGADEIAGRLAPGWGFRVEPHPAEWRALGKRAGYVRNAAMLASGIDHVYAFRSSGESKGTDQMIALAREAGVPVTVVERDDLTPE